MHWHPPGQKRRHKDEGSRLLGPLGLLGLRMSKGRRRGLFPLKGPRGSWCARQARRYVASIRFLVCWFLNAWERCFWTLFWRPMGNSEGMGRRHPPGAGWRRRVVSGNYSRTFGVGRKGKKIKDDNALKMERGRMFFGRCCNGILCSCRPDLKVCVCVPPLNSFVCAGSTYRNEHARNRMRSPHQDLSFNLSRIISILFFAFTSICYCLIHVRIHSILLSIRYSPHSLLVFLYRRFVSDPLSGMGLGFI